MQLYLEYRLKRIVTGVWANQSGVIWIIFPFCVRMKRFMD